MLIAPHIIIITRLLKKLDYASEQVKIAMHQAKALVEQSKQRWIKQRQKVQAVEMLTAKRNSVLIKKKVRKSKACLMKYLHNNFYDEDHNSHRLLSPFIF